MNWRTANNRKRLRQARAVPIFTRRNLGMWVGADWSTISRGIHDRKLGIRRERIPVRSKIEVLEISFNGPTP